MIRKRMPEFRTLAEEKGLEEQRADLLNEMNGIVKGAKAETRTLTDEEETRFEAIKSEIKKIDKTLAAIEEERALNNKEQRNKETAKEKEERTFEAFIRGQVSETRSGEQNVTIGNNGAIIPVTIANRIIKEVKDIASEELDKCLKKGIIEWYLLKSAVKKAVENYIYEKTKRRPTIIPIIMET